MMLMLVALLVVVELLISWLVCAWFTVGAATGAAPSRIAR
jgi:hypothetical protein